MTILYGIQVELSVIRIYDKVLGWLLNMLNKNKFVLVGMLLADTAHANDGLSLGVFFYMFYFYGEIGVLLIAGLAVPLSLLLYLYRRYFLKKASPRLDMKVPAKYFSFTAVLPVLLLLLGSNFMTIGMCLVHFVLLLTSWGAYFWFKSDTAQQRQSEGELPPL
jgi:hypothetical protein